MKTCANRDLLWSKRWWLFGFAACVTGSFFQPHIWLWPASAVTCLIGTLEAARRLDQARGYRGDIFDFELFSKTESPKGEGK